MANLTSFTPGDLVVSVYGNGDGSGTYTDNQASSITLEEINPSTGAVDGTLVLPQTTTNAAGVSESAISGEYGSSSEGTLELSADGKSLVIAGYGVNAAAYNQGEAGFQPGDVYTASQKTSGGTYGNSALAQTYSVPNGGTNGAPAGTTVVPRVIADIGANGSVDTSTSLLNIDNTNNPRSVATSNGSNFYVSGQGVKGDTTQGVDLATDGENDAQSGTTPTKIYTGTDTRTAELYNGNLYVSADSSINKGTGAIYSYGASPTGATTPTALPGMTGKVALNGNGNSINGSSGTVDLSPQNFFFANSTTLYVADTGNPKGGTVGDGGLQKWSYSSVSNSWSLDYTLSQGLNLVSNSTALPSGNGTGYGVDGTTGLIGLTGKVNTDGTVSLYATNATIGDLNNTYVYGITDALANTSAAAAQTESFSQLIKASPDTNIRGIAFAPQAAPCYCTGTKIRLSRRGEIVDVAVEHLRVGDIALTGSGAERPITWIGHRTVGCSNDLHRLETMPIRISAHAFGENRPARDLFVSPGHAICVDALGEVLIPAGLLVNGATIVQIDVDAVTYWHVELDSHDILLAENLPAESYLDMGNRGFFAEGEVVTLTASPDAEPAQRTHADFCRPFVDGGPILDAVRMLLRQRAEAIGWRSTDALELHLIVDGQRLDPVVRDLTARFHLPADAKDVWLVSPTARPRDAMATGDARDLGLYIGGLRIDDGFSVRDVVIDDPLLCIGFHDVEDGARRWTSGRARLPATLWDGCVGGFYLRVDLAGRPVPRWTAPEAVERPRLAIVASAA